MLQAKNSLIGNNIVNNNEMTGSPLNNPTVIEYPKLEDLTVVPTKEQQEFESKKYYGYKKVIVEGVESEVLDVKPSEETQIIEGLFDTVNVDKIETEEKEVELDFSDADINEIIPSEGKYLKSVLIEKSPDLEPENIIKDKIINGVKGNVEILDTSDATATENDLISPKTAYVNGEKITGKIIPTYIKSNLNISKEQLPVKANKNYVWDYSLENNLVISSNGYVGTTTITLNNENNIRDINISDIGSTYVNIQAAKFYQKADNNIQKILLIVNDNDNGYLVILKINIITLEIISVYVNTSKIMSGVQTYGSFGYKILIHPTMENTVTVSVKNKEKYGNGIHINIYTFRIIDTTFTQLNTFKISRGANIYGYQENNFVDMVWSPNGTNLLVIFSAREYKQFPKFVYIVYFSSNLTTATVVDTGLTENAPNCFLNDKYFIKGNNIYNYENKTITLYKTLTEFTSTNIANYIAVLNEYYLIHFVKDSNIINIYSFDEDLNFTFVKSYNWDITLSSVAICGNTLVFANYYSLDRILYSENNIIQTIYTGSGASNEYEKINIIGIDYFNTSESIVTSDKVLKDEKVFTSDGKIIGTMPNNGALNYTPSTEIQTIPVGYTSGGTIAAINYEELGTITPDEMAEAESITTDILS